MLLADSGIVTGAFTLGGVVITALAAFWLDLRRQKREDRTRWDKERLIVYSEFLTEASAIEKDFKSNDFFLSLRQSLNRASLLASPNVEAQMRKVMGRVLSLQSVLETRTDGQELDIPLKDFYMAREECLDAMMKELGTWPI